MKKIKLGGKHGTLANRYAQVDDEDYEWLNQWKWTTLKTCGIYYAYRKRVDNTYVSMHRQILELTDPAIKGDHRDGNGLNNQRSNLRIATHSQNMANRKAKGKYLGVSIDNIIRGIKYYRACCTKDHIVHRKQFRTEVEAALKYNEWAKELHGEFAKLNTISEEEMEFYRKEMKNREDATKMSDIEKLCIKCNKSQSVDMFYQYKKSSNVCKTCKNDQRKHRKLNQYEKAKERSKQ